MKNMNTEIDNSSDDILATIRILKLKPEQNLEKSGQIYGTKWMLNKLYEYSWNFKS